MVRHPIRLPAIAQIERSALCLVLTLILPYTPTDKLEGLIKRSTNLLIALP